jgi:hypothetical protein
MVAVALDQGGLALDLIGTPAQVFHQQSLQLRKPRVRGSSSPSGSGSAESTALNRRRFSSASL